MMMQLIERIWISIVVFFSPTAQDWKDFKGRKKTDSDGMGYGGDVYQSDSDDGSDCDGGGDGGGD
jgi:hypothetical protein